MAGKQSHQENPISVRRPIRISHPILPGPKFPSLPRTPNSGYGNTQQEKCSPTRDRKSLRMLHGRSFVKMVAECPERPSKTCPVVSSHAEAVYACGGWRERGKRKILVDNVQRSREAVHHRGRGETSSIDFGRREEPFEPCDCFMVFFRVSLA